jgi:hypothetical protein
MMGGLLSYVFLFKNRFATRIIALNFSSLVTFIMT